MQVKKKLLDLARDKIRLKHYSYSTERTYVYWITRFEQSIYSRIVRTQKR